MTLREKISSEIIVAMKAKDKMRLSALRFLKSLFIQNDTSVKPIDELSIVISHVKKLKDSLSLYESSSQTYIDLENEIRIVSEYLPSPLEEAEVLQMISDILKSLDKPSMGSVMKELGEKIKGRFDGKLASELVKASLAKS